uniref:Uncharacterized protein n=1 Tax=Romanomermis culicivorax TaxID=13658 RepID=A0A915HNK9_ROMCU
MRKQGHHAAAMCGRRRLQVRRSRPQMRRSCCSQVKRSHAQARRSRPRDEFFQKALDSDH